MIPNITKGDKPIGVMKYLVGPGRANEHTDPHLVGGSPLIMSWYDDVQLNEDAAVGNGTGREGSVKYRLTRALEDRAVSEADAVFTICHGLRDDRHDVAAVRTQASWLGVDLVVVDVVPLRGSGVLPR